VLGEEQAGQIKASLEESFRGYRDTVNSEFARQADRYDIGRLCEAIAEEVIEPARKDSKEPYRCTVYVRDILFEDVLCRLIDYYPGGDGQGNIYSTRYGIIGRSWRLGKHLHETAVPDDRTELITDWGMTREEAARQSAKSFVTFLLAEEEKMPPVGLFYVESKEHAFEDDLRERLAESQAVVALTTATAGVMEKMLGRGPRLELFQS
jgi:hypothetical protein